MKFKIKHYRRWKTGFLDSKTPSNYWGKFPGDIKVSIYLWLIKLLISKIILISKNCLDKFRIKFNSK